VVVPIFAFALMLLVVSPTHVSNAPVWTEQDEKNRVQQIEETKKLDKLVLSACGPSPNYNDRDVPIGWRDFYLEERKAQFAYDQCVFAQTDSFFAQPIRNREKTEQNIQPKVRKRAKKPD